jgi:16S rRNA pseudouridine516 synthase
MQKENEKQSLERLDKILAKAAVLSRKDAKRAALSGRITVDGVVVKSPEQKVSITSTICLDGKALTVNEHVYLMMNKPEGYVCSNDDPKSPNVISLIGNDYKKNDLFTVGRLDKNTTGLLLITDDGNLAHFLLSPKHHVKKRYFLRSKFILTDQDAEAFFNGVDIGEKKPTKSALLEICEDRYSAYLTITEGKFHQIKRMLEVRGNKVVFLTRTEFGGIKLDENLSPGGYRPLNENEKNVLKKEAEI